MTLNYYLPYNSQKTPCQENSLSLLQLASTSSPALQFLREQYKKELKNNRGVPKTRASSDLMAFVNLRLYRHGASLLLKCLAGDKKAILIKRSFTIWNTQN